jgi:aldose sugar dehydrogenase
LVYLFWTESSTGTDTGVLASVPLLGNRVDRFLWNGSTLTFDRNLIRLRAFQEDAGQFARGNHNGGVMKFGPDGKLYIFMGDNGRRGHLQNLPCGPTATCPGATVADDQFGGPAPDNAHLTGVILRLNDDGSTPTDNPFFAAGAAIGGEVGLNIQKIFAYGLRNSFGMDFDPKSGNLWLEENGDDSFTELGLIEPGTNHGWLQIMGPVSRIVEYKTIETNVAADPCLGTPGLQQNRWPPTLIAGAPTDALARLFMLPGAVYRDPQFSWKFEVAPAGIGFVKGQALGPQYDGDLIMGAARPTLEGGYLFHFKLTDNRRQIAVADPRLEDRVADNVCKFDITESESLLIGRNFGVGTDIQTGPNGNLFVVSLSNGAIYEIFRRRSHDFNGDARSDIAWRQTGTGAVSLWLMNGATISQPVSLGAVSNNWQIVSQRDFNGDGKSDLLWRDTTSGTVSIWFLDGTSVTSTAGVGTAPTTWSIAGTGDFNADGRGDLLWRDTAGNAAIWLFDGSTVLQAAGIGTIPVSWIVAGVADFNGDGKADILWRNTSTGVNVIWFLDGVTIASTAAIATVPTTWSIVATGDFNGDSKADIVWRDTSGNVAIWLMNGSTVLQNSGLGAVPANWSISETGDLNGDGKSDLLWRDTTSGTVSIWFLDGTSVTSTAGLGTVPTNWVIQNMNVN